MSTLETRLAELTADLPRGWKASLARHCQVEPPSVSDWVTGRTKTLEGKNLLLAAQYFRVEPHWLATGRGSKYPAVNIHNQIHQPETKSIGRIDPSNVQPITPKGADVPLISQVQAGMWAEIQDVFHPGDAERWITPIYSKPKKHAFALTVIGDSMESPYPGARHHFPAGTVIIVDPDIASSPGDFVVAKDVSMQEATFKQLMTDSGRWFLKPLNPSYPTIEIDDPAIRVIGRVIEFQPPGGKL